MSTRHRSIFTIVLIGLLAPRLLAGEEHAPSSVKRSEIESLLRQYADAKKEYEDAVASATTREDRQRVKLLLQPKPVPNASRFLDWAELHPTDDLATDILVLIIVTGGKTKPAIRAVNLLAAHHLDLDSDRFFKVAPSVFNAVAADEADRWMRKFAVGGSSRQTQAVALFLLGRFKAGLARTAEMLGSPQFADAMKQSIDQDEQEFLRTLDIAKTNHEAELLFEELISKFPEAEFQGRRLSELAKPEYFAVSKLAIGKLVPEIKGQDLNGEPMVLSDYRGKVVVLCFWGTWCAPCMKMVPHHKELISRHKDAPFAFLGITTDQDRDKLDAVSKAEEITWRSWWDGGDTGNPISTTWSIKSWPSIFVVDHQGCIRHKNLYHEELDAAVASLLDEVAGKPSN